MTWLFHPAVPWVIATLTTLGCIYNAFIANLYHWQHQTTRRQLAEQRRANRQLAETVQVQRRRANRWRDIAWQSEHGLAGAFGRDLERIRQLPERDRP